MNVPIHTSAYIIASTARIHYSSDSYTLQAAIALAQILVVTEMLSATLGMLRVPGVLDIQLPAPCASHGEYGPSAGSALGSRPVSPVCQTL